VSGKTAGLRFGKAAAPKNAPLAVKRAIWAANQLRHKPYRYGGGQKSFDDRAYDCSGTISYVLGAAGLISSPMSSTEFRSYGDRGPGKWITIYAREGHTFAVIAGLRLDTTPYDRYTGKWAPRWQTIYRPQFVGYDPYMTRYLTEPDLLAQRTGRPAYTGDALDSFGYDRAEILRRLRFFKPRYSLREVAQYSNPGFFVAGEVAGAASQHSWNDLVETRLFNPLEMSRSGTRTKDLQNANVTAAHALVDGKVVVVEPTKLDTTGAASSATSTAADMSKLMLMFLNKGAYNGKQMLKPETVEEIFKRSMVSKIDFSDLPPISDKTGFYYGLGVGSYDYAGHQIIEKGGALAGVRTILVLVPDKNAGIVVLANLNLTAFPEAVRAYFLNQLLGLDREAGQKEIFADNEKLKKLLAPPPAPKNPGKFNEPLQSLVGIYENDYYGRCDILQDGDALKIECGPAKYPATLKHWNNGAFLLQFPGATQVPFITTFMIGEDGNADGFANEALGIFTRVQEKK
jgi:CubicO group peptidase (beta-lactamase class C family)